MLMRKRSVRWLLLFVYLSVLRTASARAEPPPLPDTYAIVGARVEVGDGRVIPYGTVLLRDGLIGAVGRDLPVPPEAAVIKGEGLVVYPGFVDASSTKGLKLPEWQPDQDVPPDRAADAPPSMREANRKGVRPELRAVDYLALTDAELAPYRKDGFATALLAPSGGTINGVSALVNLSGLPTRDCVVRPDVAVGFAFHTTGSGYPQSLMGIFAQIRQTLLDAGYFRTLQAAFQHGSSHRPPADETLAALQPVLNGTLPVLFDAGSENEIRRALKLADEEGWRRLIINGAAEAWKLAPLLARRQIPVLASLEFGEEPGAKKSAGEEHKPGSEAPKPEPPSDGAGDPPAAVEAAAVGPPENQDEELPEVVVQERHRRWEERVANAARLHQAGVLFAFSTQGTHSLTDFWQNLRRAVQAGLPREAALAALSFNAARIFGVEKQMGTVEAGKIANLVVMTGDFIDPKAKVRYLFIDGRKFEPDHGSSE